MRKGVRGSGGGTRRKGGSLQTKWDRLHKDDKDLFTGHLWVANKSDADAKRFSRFLLSSNSDGTYEVRYKRDKNKGFISFLSPGLGYGKFTFTRNMLLDLADGNKLQKRFNDESHKITHFQAIQITETDKLKQWLSDHKQQLHVTVPPGVTSGQTVRVNAPDGPLYVIVPTGVNPGQVFTVPYPPASAPAPAPAQTGPQVHNKINLKCEITQTQPPEYSFIFSVDEFEFDVFIHKIYKKITFTIDQDITQMMKINIPNEFIPLNKYSPTSTIPPNIFPQGTKRGDTCTIHFIPPESYATTVAPFYKVPVRTVTKQYLFYLSYRLGQTLYDMFTDPDVIGNMTPAIWRTLRNVTTFRWITEPSQRHDISAIVHLTSANNSYDKVCGFSLVGYTQLGSEFGIYEIELPGATPGATPLTLKGNRILYSDIVPLTGSLAEWDIKFLNPNDSTPLQSRTCTQWYDLLYEENLSGNVIDVKDLEASFEEYGRQCTHVINDPSVSTIHQVVKTHIKKLCQIGSNFYLQNTIKNTIG